MAQNPALIDEKVVQELNDKSTETSALTLKEQIATQSQLLLIGSQMYKQPRMNLLAIFERLYNNDIPPKIRQMFNAVLPIFSGLIDELLAMFNDEIQIKFNALNPAQELVVPKIQAHWDAERVNLSPNARWDYKGRTDRFNAVLSGRGIFKEYAYNDPEYTNVLEVVNYSDFHCQPLGGGLLENHTFCGTEGNYRSLYELKTNPKYDKEQVKKLENYAWADRQWERLEDSYGTKFARWKALGLDPETNSFTGEPTYNLCDFVMTYNGVRYNVVFEPCSSIWLYIEKWTDDMPSGRYPFKSYATHEDDKNFWSKGYADDFITIANAVITLFNQELTNREKANFNARAFDKDMFEDLAKLDASQYRPDSLVPANTAGGTKKIAEGIYQFQTPQLQGTVNLIDWASQYTGSKTGADELPQGSEKNKKAIVQLQQQKQSKRIGLRSDAFQACYQELGETYLEGLREYMEPSVSVQIIGENGFLEERDLKRIEVRGVGKLGISITSSSEQEQGDTMKKNGQIQAITMISQNPNLTKYEKETIYRNVGQFDENEIMFLLDTQGNLSKKQFAHASDAIQKILLNKKPEIYYGADISYLKYIKQFFVDNRNKIKGKEKDFTDFIAVMGPIIQQNMTEQAKDDSMQKQQAQPQPGADGKPVAPAGGGAPITPAKTTAPTPSNVRPAQPMTLPQ